MTKQITTYIKINASREKVWEILTDYEKYPEWNPFVKSLTGVVKVGNRIEIKLPGMKFKPVVLTLDKNTEFKWLGHFLFKELFDGEHRFHLSDDGNGVTHLGHSESFKGILVKPLLRSIGKSTKQGFEEMNGALKLRAENFS